MAVNKHWRTTNDAVQGTAPDGTGGTVIDAADQNIDNDADVEARGLSDRDLEPLLLAVPADHIVLILDACHSGQALESDEWRRGPLNSRGLIQARMPKLSHCW